MSFPALSEAVPLEGAPRVGESEAPEEDQAIAFLTALVPPAPTVRSRAFAALLRAMTTPRGAQ